VRTAALLLFPAAFVAFAIYYAGLKGGAVGWGTGLAFACLAPLAFALGPRMFGRTVSNLKAKAPSQPLFMLATFDVPEDEAPHPSMRVKSPPRGFAPFAAWQEGERCVVLLRQAD
jgi:hypothetical protein